VLRFDATLSRSFSLALPIVRLRVRCVRAPVVRELPPDEHNLDPLGDRTHSLLDHLESSQIRSAARATFCFPLSHSRASTIRGRLAGRIAIAEQEEGKNKRREKYTILLNYTICLKQPSPSRATMMIARSDLPWRAIASSDGSTLAQDRKDVSFAVRE